MINIVGECIESYEGAKVPIGYVYIQFPNKPEPRELFGGTWVEIRQGSTAIGTTIDSAPVISISNVNSSTNGAHIHCNYYKYIVLTCACTCTCQTSCNGGHYHTYNFTNANTGTQAYGITVKAWKRTA